MKNLNVTEIDQLQQELLTNGKSVDQLEIGAPRVGAIAVRTESDAQYLIETSENSPHFLISRFAEKPPYYGEYRLHNTGPIVRREGNPDKKIEIDKPMVIRGMPRNGIDFDPDSIYQTLPLTEIRFIQL